MAAYQLERKFMGGESMHSYDDIMSLELALEIKEARLGIKSNQQSTWRMVATIISIAHPDLEIEKGNQIVGKELCAAAAYYLNETNWD